MVKEDPLHRLSRNTTTAFRNQRYSVWKEAEKDRVQEIPKWGTPSKATPTKSSGTPLPRVATPGAAIPSRIADTRPVLTTTPKKTPSISLKFQNVSTPSKKTPRARSSRIPSVITTTKLNDDKSDFSIDADEKKVNDMKQRLKALEKKRSGVVDGEKPTPDNEPIPEAAMKIDVPDKEKALELFDQLDGNASGKLSLAELDKGVIVLFPEFNHKKAIMAAYKAADRSGDGFVSRSEFGYFLRFIVYYNNLWSIFAALDKDNDHRVSKEEFVKAADKLDLGRDADEVFGEMDVTCGGMVLFDELCAWLAQDKSDWGADEADVKDLKERLVTLEKRNVAIVVDREKPAPNNEPIPEAAIKIDIPDKEKALELFDQLDGNASGKLSLAELDKGVIVLFPEFNHKKAIMAAYKAADLSGDGFVSRSEFGYFLRFIVYYNHLWSIFAALDKDNDHRVSKEEFVKAADKLDLGRDADEVFDEMDVNGGGMVLFDELCAWLAQHKSDWGADEAESEKVTSNLANLVVKETKEPEMEFVPEPIPEALQFIKVPPKAEAMELFDRLDDNASGKLSLAELDKGVLVLYPELNNKLAIMAAYKAADRKGDGFIRRSEFGYFLRFILYYNKVWQVFESVDMDGDRRITKDEFVKAADKLDLGRDAEEVFAEMDVNGGGMVLFGELCHWLAEHKSEWTRPLFEQKKRMRKRK